MRRRAVIALLMTTVMAIGLAAVACGGDDDALTIYSGRSENLVGPLLERFSEQTGVPVEVRYGDTAELALLISEEGSGTPADLFLSQSPGATAFLAERELLAEIPGRTERLVDPRFRDPENRWVGVSGRERVLVYNRDLVEEDELPDSVLDLTGPAYRGRVAVAPTNGSFIDFVTAMRDLLGEEEAGEWLRGMAANGARAYANNNAIVEAVGRGEIPMGLVNHYYNFRFLAEDPGLPSRNHHFADGDVGALVIPSSVSILAGTDHPDDAERLVDFLLSTEAQAYFAEETFEYPLARGVPAAEGVPPLTSLAPPDEDPGRLGDIQGTARLIAESGLN